MEQVPKRFNAGVPEIYPNIVLGAIVDLHETVFGFTVNIYICVCYTQITNKESIIY